MNYIQIIFESLEQIANGESPIATKGEVNEENGGRIEPTPYDKELVKLQKDYGALKDLYLEVAGFSKSKMDKNEVSGTDIIQKYIGLKISNIPNLTEIIDRINKPIDSNEKVRVQSEGEELQLVGHYEGFQQWISLSNGEKKLIGFINNPTISKIGYFLDSKQTPGQGGVDTIGINIVSLKKMYEELIKIAPKTTMTIEDFMQAVILQECFHFDFQGYNNDLEESFSDLVSLRYNSDFLYSRLSGIILNIYQHTIINNSGANINQRGFNGNAGYQKMQKYYCKAMIQYGNINPSFKESMETVFSHFKHKRIMQKGADYSDQQEARNDVFDCLKFISTEDCKSITDIYEELVTKNIKLN